MLKLSPRILRSLRTSSSRSSSYRCNNNNNNNNNNSSSNSSGNHRIIDSAEVVICGAGITGCSIAFQLAQLGCSSILVLDQGPNVACGTTWHSLGLIGQLRQTGTLAKLAVGTVQQCKQLDELGYSTGYRRTGSLALAESQQQLHALHKSKAMGDYLGIESVIMSPAEVTEMVPDHVMSTENVLGCLYTPNDGCVTNAGDYATACLSAAKDRGAAVRLNTRVRQILLGHDGAVSGVLTNAGVIECRNFVNAGGQWARQLGRRSNQIVQIPALSCEHFAMLVEAPSIGSESPVVRNLERGLVAREWNGKFCVGGFEPRGSTVFVNGAPSDFANQLLPDNHQHFQQLRDLALQRFPLLKDAQHHSIINGPESFTPDGLPIFGEAPNIPGYFVLTGMNSLGVTLSGGAAAAMAQLIRTGRCQVDMTSLDIRRFVQQHSDNPLFLGQRIPESFANLTRTGPRQSFSSGRQLIVSALHESQKELGATFEQVPNGYERPVLFDPNYSEQQLHAAWRQFGAPDWLEATVAEWHKLQKLRTIVNHSSATQLRITAQQPDDLEGFIASTFERRRFESGLNRLPGGDDVAVTSRCGKFVEFVGRLVKQTENSAIFIGPSSAQTRAFHSLNQRNTDDSTVTITDVTVNYCLLQLPGAVRYGELPRLTSDAFVFADETDAFVLAQAGNAAQIYRFLNRSHGFAPVGHYAVTMARLADGLPTLGEDFQGAFSSQQLLQIRKFALKEHEPFVHNWAWGGEPVWCDGEPISTILCSSFHPVQRRLLAFAVLPQVSEQCRVMVGEQQFDVEFV